MMPKSGPAKSVQPTVLHLDHSLESGGAEIALARICEKSRLWKPIIAVPTPPAGSKSKGYFDRASEQYTVASIGPYQRHGATSGHVLQSAIHIWRAIRQAAALRLSQEFRQSNVIHANTSRAGLYGVMACMGSGRPFVVHLRDMVTAESLGKVGAWLYSRVVLPKATAVISNSKSTLATAEPFIRSNALVQVIPSPTGMTPPSLPIRTAKSISRIGMVARIDPWKGQDLLIRAFANVYRNQNVHLVLAGSPAFGHEQYWEELHALVEELGIAEQVEFLGHVNDVGELLQGLDVCVQASIRPEPLGQNVLQYLYCGRPTIAANDGGPREWIVDGKTGLLFRTGNLDSLTNCLRVIRDPSLRSDLSSNALQCSNVPSDQEISDRHADVFMSVSRGQYNSNYGHDNR